MPESWKTPSIEEDAKKEGEGKRVLHELEATGRYVFHGSPTPNLDELEIRQPYDWKSGTPEKHGDPSVVATPYADIAIFRSLVYHDSTGFGVSDDGPHFEASRKALELAKQSVGHVYVLPRADFAPMEGDETEMDWRAKNSQQPERIVRVTFEDLPTKIGVIE